MPKIGLTSPLASCASSTSRTWSIVACAIAGFPGPFERKRPSWSFISGWSGVSHGTSVTSQPRCTRERMMFALMPQSVDRMRGEPPLPYTFVSVIETSATRFRAFASTKPSAAAATAAAGVNDSSNSIFARSAPFSRIFLVRRRVSMP